MARRSAAQTAEDQDLRLDVLRFALDIYREHSYQRGEGEARPLPPTHEQVLAQAKLLYEFVKG